MEKNLNMVRDSRNSKRSWAIYLDSEEAIEIITRMFKDDVVEVNETNGVFGKNYSILMLTAPWRRNEIVDILGLKQIKEVVKKKGWVIDL